MNVKLTKWRNINMKKILKYITLLIVTVMCASCEEAIDGDTLIVISEREYGARTESKSLYTIKYESLNINNGLTMYIVSDSKDFEVGDKVKLVKVEE